MRLNMSMSIEETLDRYWYKRVKIIKKDFQREKNEAVKSKSFSCLYTVHKWSQQSRLSTTLYSSSSMRTKHQRAQKRLTPRIDPVGGKAQPSILCILA